MASKWKDGAEKTRYPGIYRTKTGYRVRVRAVDPRTGTTKEANRHYEGISVKQALEKQIEMRSEALVTEIAARVRVGDFAKSWLEAKKPNVDPVTAERYVYVLEDHFLPSLGKFYADAVRPLDLQRWINKQIAEGYKARTVRGWYEVARCMLRDAVHQLDLPRDPTQRITLPQPDERTDVNALTPDQLRSFLAHAKEHYPRQYAFLAILALTGMRFCHASALRWEDVDEEAKVIRVQRKQVGGKIGRISRKKRVPREYPLDPGLAKILREHRQRMVREQEKGIETGWIFPGRTGELRDRGAHRKALNACAKAAGVKGRFTAHGMRRTFNDLSRRAGVDALVTRSLTGHVTEQMQEHYSTIGMDEKRAAVASVVKLVQGISGE